MGARWLTAGATGTVGRAILAALAHGRRPAGIVAGLHAKIETLIDEAGLPRTLVGRTCSCRI